MNISIIGASAGVGYETLKRALDRNHNVTTLSRSEINLPKCSNLKAITGDATDRNDLRRAIQNADAIIVTLGTRKSMEPTRLFSDFAQLLVEVQQEVKIDGVCILVTGFGAGESKKFVGWFVQLFLKYFLKDVYSDKTKMEEIVSKSTLNWIIVRPGRLLDKPLTENYRIETELYKGIRIGGINRSDVADYLIKQAENPTELKKYAAISQK